MPEPGYARKSRDQANSLHFVAGFCTQLRIEQWRPTRGHIPMNERDIFIACLDKTTAEERLAYLNLVCGGDATLRQRVEALLQMHDRTGDFLQKPLAERLAEGVAAAGNSADVASAIPN